MTSTALRVFVTGASGFIGAHVVRALSHAGHHTTALVRSPARADGIAALPNVTLIAGDLTAPSTWRAKLAGHDACIHLALVWGAPEDDLALADLRACATLFESAALAGVEHTIYTSSTAVHRPFRAVMRADEPLRGVDFYGATKASAEAFLSAVCHQHPMRENVLRPGAVVGLPAVADGTARIDRQITAMRDAARRDEVLRLPDTVGRQFIGASDLARLYVALLEHGCNHERFVAVAPEVIPWAEIAARVIEHVGRGRLEASAPSPAAAAVFDVEKTVRTLGSIPSARSALWDALRWHCESAPRM